MSPFVALLVAIFLLVYWRVALALAVIVIVTLIILGMASALEIGHGTFPSIPGQSG